MTERPAPKPTETKHSIVRNSTTDGTEANPEKTLFYKSRKKNKSKKELEINSYDKREEKSSKKKQWKRDSEIKNCNTLRFYN
jgi:hypothetical protein